MRGLAHPPLDRVFATNGELLTHRLFDGWSRLNLTFADALVQCCLTAVMPLLAWPPAFSARGKEFSMNTPPFRTIQIDGLSIFYREAGPKNAQRFSCCTDFLPRRVCLNRFSRGYPTAII